jgi:hypothetical protein
MMSGPGMMGSPDISAMMLWIPLGILVGVVLLVGVIWLARRWLKHRRTLAMPNTPQPKDAYQDYQQGYQSQQPSPEIYEEGEQCYPYPPHEQPQAQHPETMPFQR